MAVNARLSGLAPWSGLIAAATGFALQHQVVSDALHFDCSRTSDGVGMALGLASLVLVVFGAFWSWRARPGQGARGAGVPLRRFVADLSLMASLLAALGIGFMILAGAILPGCRP